MNPLYLETLRRRRTFFVVLLAAAVVAATWAAAGEPKLYRATVSLWSDLPGGSSAEAIGAPPPAAQEQSLLNELLTTNYFRVSVARRGPLGEYLETGPREGWGPSALLRELRGSGTLDERIAAALSAKRLTSVVRGPHVLEIHFEASSPALAAGTLRALVAEFATQRVALRGDSFESYREQVRDAATALSEARAALSAYVDRHPGEAQTPELARLARAERDAARRLATATRELNEATSAFDPDAFQNTLRVIDRAEAATAPTAGRKRVVLGALAGLFAGGVLTVLGVIGLALGGDYVGRTRELGRPPARPQARVPTAFRDGDGVVAEELTERPARWARRR